MTDTNTSSGAEEQPEERAAFEAWALNAGFPIRRLPNSEAGRDYGIDSAQDAWEAWQARAALASAAAPAEQPGPWRPFVAPSGYAVVEHSIGTTQRAYSDGWNDATDHHASHGQAPAGAAILFEREDGRYAVNPDTTGDPAWHRLGPVDISALAASAQSGLTDAYAGAREDLSIWKRRALEAERDLRSEKQTTSRLVGELNAANGPAYMGEPAASPAYGATEYGWADYRRLQDGDKRLIALVVGLYGNDHQSSSDLEGLLDRASRGQVPAQQPAPSPVPAGWKLVPVEPTEGMLKAADDGDDAYTLRCFGPGIQRVMQGPYDHYCAMLDAASAQPDSVLEDAARYQLLRRGQHWSVVDGIGNDLRAEALDAAIDAAMAAKKGDAT